MAIGTTLSCLNNASHVQVIYAQALTPTSSSWLNMIERFFRDLTQNRLRRGVFQDLEQLIMGIGDYIDGHNKNPKPFIWTAKASDILEKVTRAQAMLNNRRSA